jgi:DNA-binding CsgD family transcriptional regulator
VFHLTQKITFYLPKPNMTEKIEKSVSDALKIESKISEIAFVADLIPGVIIIHNLPEFRVVYMSQMGLNGLDKKLEEISILTNKEYHNNFFNPDDAADYVPKILSLLERNTDDMVTFFQQVRTTQHHDWVWYLSAIKILLRDEDEKPMLTITIAMAIDPQHHVTAKVSRLLDENNFLRKHFQQFARLSKRECDVLKWLALGKSSAEIAEILFISVATVETHRKNIKQKLNVKNIYELSQYARAFDLI